PETFNIAIPDDLRRAVEACGGDKERTREVGLEWTTMQARELKAAGVPVIHFYTMSRTENIARIAKSVF
ncbi:MAG: methylenetetrahydrofolate reductase, partial [Alistipes sp.]|nr:methylenetetrahydrofolate reductase [Alistipes sp.]